MKNVNLALRLALGAAAGAIGTAAIFSALAANKKLAPETEAPMRKDPGEFMIERAEEAALTKSGRKEIPKTVETVAANAMHLSYGAACGTLYALVRPKPASVIIEGVGLGTAIWAVSYLGWLPAVGLLPPPGEQKPIQILTPVWQHWLYGIVTVTAYEKLARLAAPKNKYGKYGDTGNGI